MQVTTKLIPFAIALAFAGSASAQQVVKIGHVAPISGPSAHLGKDNENAARMAIDELNAKGFTLNGQKVTLQLVSEDDGADPKQGTAVAQKLVDAKVNGVIGHLNSGTTVPASKIYNDAGIVQISPATTAPVYTRQHFPGAFRVVASDAKLGSTMSKYATDTLHAKNIAIIDDRTTYGQGVADEFAKGLKKPGIKVVGREFTSATATDYTAILTSIKAKKPDLIFFGGMDSVAGPMLKQMKALGINAVFMGGDGMCTDALGRLAGEVERAGVGAAAQPVDRLLGDADALGGDAGDAAIGERFDIFALFGGSEAVMPVAERDRIEIKVCRRAGSASSIGEAGAIGGLLGGGRKAARLRRQEEGRAGLIGRRLGGEEILVLFHPAGWIIKGG